MPEWASGIRQHLDLGGLASWRQHEIVEDLAQQLEDAFRDGLAQGLSEEAATAFAWSQCPDWAALSQQLRHTKRGSPTALDRRDEAVDRAARHPLRRLCAGLTRDLLFAVRTMRVAPTFTAAAVVTLALGIGANTTIFSIINATLLRPLPFPDSDRLALCWETDAKGAGRSPMATAPRFWDWHRESRAFEHMAVFDSAGKGYALGAGDGSAEAEQVAGVRVSAEYFDVLGIPPFLGRSFLPEEEILGRDRVVVLGHGLWQRRYGADRSLVGRAIRIDGQSYTVVGVMPREFRFQFWSDEPQLWVPAGWNDGDRGRNAHSFVAIGRLAPGIRMAAASAELGAIQERLRQQHPEDADTGTLVTPLAEFGLQNVQRTFRILLVSVALVLLIGCVNVANLMLARGLERGRELAIRRAMGASSWRIVRQLVVESLLISAAGGAAGLLLASWASRAVVGVLPAWLASLPLRPLDTIGMDPRVLGFALLVTGCCGVAFGIVPALAAMRGQQWVALQEGGRGGSRGRHHVLRHLLVASEVGLTLVVVMAAGLLVKSMTRLVAVDPGFDAKSILTATIRVSQSNPYHSPPDNARLCEQISEQVGTLPGVLATSAAAHLPLRGNAGRGFGIEGRPDPPAGVEGPGAHYTVACPGYFRTLGVPIRKGREFTHGDTVNSPGVVVINEALAERYWPDENPIGQRIVIGRQRPNAEWLTIVGVVGNVRHWGLAEDLQPQFFRPYTQAAWPWMHLVVKTAISPTTLGPAVKRAMAVVEPDRPLSGMRTMEETVRRSLGSRRFPMLVLGAFAGLALVLAAVGIAGVVSHGVSSSTRELGIRLALGAPRGSVLGLVMRRCFCWVLVGVAAGVGLSMAVARLLAGMLYDVRPTDPAVLVASALVLCLVALGAAFAPARRSTRIDPVTALRAE